MGIKTIYLAGTGRKGDEFASGWRREAEKKFWDMGIKTLDPFRNKDLSEKCEIYNPNEIVVRDLWDIRRSDLVFAEMTQDNCPYIGTSMEVIAASKFYDKPVVIWASEKMSYHYWLRALAVHISTDFEECIDYIGGMWTS